MLENITKKNGKEWVNVQAKLFTNSAICNQLGLRVGDIVKLRIKDEFVISKVSDFITVPNKLVFSQDEINEIKHVGSIRKQVNLDFIEIIKPQFNVEENIHLVGILSHLFSDGSISSTVLQFTNKDIELIEHFESLVKECFPNIKIRRWNDDGVLHSIIKNTEVVSIISRFVDTFGRKSITNLHIPKFIKENKEFSREWLRHAFTDEGWIKDKRSVQMSRQIRFKNDKLMRCLDWKLERVIKDGFQVITSDLQKEQLNLVPCNNMLNDESEMLNNLGVKTSVSVRKKVHLVNNSVSATFELLVRMHDFKNISFCCGKKQRKLESMV